MSQFIDCNFEIQDKPNLLDASINVICGEVAPYIDVAREICKIPAYIQDKLFVKKFSDILNGIYRDKDEGRKWASKLNDADKTSAQRIVSYVYELDSMAKNKYVINISRALANEFIDRQLYFRLFFILKSILDEDIKFIIDNLRHNVSSDEIHMEALSNLGLAYVSEIGNSGDKVTYAFSDLCYIFYEYAIKYDSDELEKVNKPKKMPEKMLVKQIGIVEF